MKIVLVNPPLSALEQTGGSSFEKVANITQPLGLAYLAAVLEKDGFEVRIIDCPQSNMMYDKLTKLVKDENPQMIGITATTLSFPNAVDAAKKIKLEIPDSYIVLGGPHVTAAPDEAIKNTCFDIGVLREGEITLLEIARKMRDEDRAFDKSSIRGVVYLEDGTVKFTQMREYIKDLDSLPFPARHLLPPISEYHPTPISCRNPPLGTLITTRGCPNQCAFCDRKIFGNLTRFRSPGNIVDEIEELIEKYGAKEIKFWDDTFTANQQRAFDICDEIIRRKINIPWSCLTRVNTVSKELLKRMKDAGCWQVAYGLESGSQKILDLMKKGITIEQSTNAVKWTKEVGLNVRGYFVLGFPGETRETIRNTINFAKKMKLDGANFYMFIPFPGAEIFHHLDKKGLILHRDYRFYHEMTDEKFSKLPYVPEGFTEKEIKSIYAKMHKEFYLNPSFIFRQITSIRRFNDIKRYWNGLLTILNL